MRAMRAETFSGYQGLKLIELPKPAITDGKVLVRMTAAGVTPLDHTIISGQFPPAKAPLVLGNEGAGVVEEVGADPTLRDCLGYGTVHGAAGRGMNDVILYLVSKGADPTLIGRSGLTASA